MIKPLTEKRITLITTMFGAFLTPYMGSAINIALPAISKEFDMTAVSTSWIATAYLLTAAVFLVPLGRVADIWGRKKVFTMGTVIFILSSLICAWSVSGATLILGRIIQGIGSPMIFGTGVAILTSVFPPGEKGKSLGFNTAATYLGLTLGPVLGGILTNYLGWRAIFYSAAIFALFPSVMILLFIKKEWAGARGESFDYVGSILYGFMLIAIMYGFSRITNISGIASMLMGLALLIVFILFENRQNHPVLNINLFRGNTIFTFSNLAALINYAATFAVGFLMSFYLQITKGMIPQEAGIVLLIQPLIQALFSPLSGRLSDKVEPRWIASIGMGLTALGLFALSFLNTSSSLLVIAINLACLGLGFALFSSPNTNAVMSSVTPQFYGVASGTLGTMRLLGQMFSLGIAMLVFAIYIGSRPINQIESVLFIKIMHIAFIIFSGLCAFGIIASLLRGNRNNNKKPLFVNRKGAR